MATETDRIKAEIEATRKDLARDVDRLTEQASPGRLAGRPLERLRSGVTSLTERVMGASSEAASTVAGAVGDAASDAGAAVAKGPKKLAGIAKGSPVAVGVIAFGGGLLAAALLRESDAERRAVRQLAETLGPAVEPLQQAGLALAGDVRATVESAAGEVRTAAVVAAAGIGAAAAAGATDVRDTAVGAASHTLQDASDRSRALIEQTRRGSDPL
jgi:hypothetical protein